MKNFTQYLIVAAIIGMAALNVQARTISINVREVKGDLTEYLRNVGQGHRGAQFRRGQLHHQGLYHLP